MNELVDGMKKIEDVSFHMYIQYDEELANDISMADNPQELRQIEDELSESYFNEAALPRRGSIRGPAISSDLAFAVVDSKSTPETVSLAPGETLLHGLAMVSVYGFVSGTDGDTFDHSYRAMFKAEDMRDGKTYFFPFDRVEQIEYSKQSHEAQKILEALAGFKEQLRPTLASPRFMTSGLTSKRGILLIARDRAAAKLKKEIGETIFTATTSEYFFFKRQNPSKRDLTSQNSSLGGLHVSDEPHKIKGAFVGYSVPFILQPSLLDEHGHPTTNIDPYEPLVVLHDDNSEYDFLAIPEASLLDLR